MPVDLLPFKHTWQKCTNPSPPGPTDLNVSSPQISRTSRSLLNQISVLKRHHKVSAGNFSSPGRKIYDVADPVLLCQLELVQMYGLVGLEKLKFPDECFPFDINECTEKILRPMGNKKKLYRNNAWVNCPDANTPRVERESKVCAIFNSIGESIMGVGGLGKELIRKWTSRFTPPVPHDSSTRRLYIVLMNTTYTNVPRDKFDWLRVLGETGLDAGGTTYDEENNAQLIFGAQLDRRFVLGLSLDDAEMTLYVFNRGCVLTSDAFDIHQQPERLIRILAGFMFASREFLGFDKKMELTRVDGRLFTKVMINNNIYDIKQVLHTENVLHGRATVCLRVTRDGRTYVVKSSWVDMSYRLNEHDILQKVKGISNVTQMVEYECVKLDTGIADSTVVDIEQFMMSNQLTGDQIRQFKEVDNLQQVRVVLSPFGRPLRMFKSIRELFGVFLDTVEAIEQLHEKKILHQDISLGNVLITDEEEEGLEGRGLLIDFDRAVWLVLNGRPATLNRAGTIPFMAVDVLEGYGVRRYDHDLESLFCVMCYLLCTSAGPNGLMRDDFDIQNSVFDDWLKKERRSMETIAHLKTGTLSVQKTFERRILLHLPPYFNIPAVKTCLLQLRSLMFGSFDAEWHHEGVNTAIYKTEREDRDPKKFFNAFKLILRTAYENMPEESATLSASSTSASSIPAQVQAEGEIPSPPVDKADANQHNGSPDGFPTQKSSPVVAGPSDSGIGTDMGSNLRKRKARSVEEEAEPVSSKRHRGAAPQGDSEHRQPGVSRGVGGSNVKVKLAAVEDECLEMPIEDKARRPRKRTKVYPSNPRVEGPERDSSRRVTRSIAKALGIDVTARPKAPVKSMGKVRKRYESGTVHGYPTRSKTRL